ncbi:MAG: hypothetical protein K1X51_12005 [Rhodospirillaceae bacterium]|nr:hypothetical protein [Rhodospirillaceae bacterium]
MRTGRLANILLAAAAVLLAYGICEGVLYLLAGFDRDAGRGSLYRVEDLYVSNRPVAVFDQVSGYRRPPGPTRIARIVHDTVAFDHVFTPNNAGYISARNYQPAPPPDTARIVVLGDSFTAAEFNDRPWPDTVHDALRGRTPRPVEIYSFAVNGGGLGNWHSIFFDDIVPHYAFDALVIAIFGDDLLRGYSYLHYDGSDPYIGYFPTRAMSSEDFFANYLPRMQRHNAPVLTDAEIDALERGERPGWRSPDVKPRIPGLARRLAATLRRPHREDTAVKAPPPLEGAVDLAALEARYGPEASARLREIMAYCRDRGIPIVLAAIPGREDAKAAAERQPETANQKEVRVLAEAYGALYMDGHAPFANVPPGDIDERYWLKYDAHWNQAGSDLFAGAMTDFLLAHPELLSRHAK